FVRAAAHRDASCSSRLFFSAECCASAQTPPTTTRMTAIIMPTGSIALPLTVCSQASEHKPAILSNLCSACNVIMAIPCSKIPPLRMMHHFAGYADYSEDAERQQGRTQIDSSL